MKTFLTILLIIAIVLIAFFVLTFTVYMFNLDMKMMAKLEPLFEKIYDKRKRDPKV